MINKAIILISLGLVLTLSLLVLPTISESIDTARGGTGTENYTATENDLTAETFVLPAAGTVSLLTVNSTPLTDPKEEGDTFTGYDLAVNAAADNTTNHEWEITAIMDDMVESMAATNTTLYIEIDNNILVQDGVLTNVELSWFEISTRNIAIRDNANGNVINCRDDGEYEYCRVYDNIEYSGETITFTSPADIYMATTGTPFDYYVDGTDVILTADRTTTDDTVAITYSSVRDLGGASGLLDLIPIAIVAAILIGAGLAIKKP